jgi:hypothetical protein
VNKAWGKGGHAATVFCFAKRNIDPDQIGVERDGMGNHELFSEGFCGGWRVSV